jgi:peptidylprolyl isomerase
MQHLARIASLVLVPLALTGAAAMAAKPSAALSPVEVIAAAPATDWTAVAPQDLVVMDLAPDVAGHPRRVVIQLLPAPFSQGWIGNIRALATAHWWDGTSVNRVQDNYVVQWGDPDGEDKAKARPLPPGLKIVAQSDYTVHVQGAEGTATHAEADAWLSTMFGGHAAYHVASHDSAGIKDTDAYADETLFWRGWPLGAERKGTAAWPVHCYGMVGVGRDTPPDTGSGAELYVVIGHAPRQLDRNIALVGRVIDGIANLSSLPRGTGDIGFYKTAPERTPIVAIRNGPEVGDLPRYEYLNTDSVSFARFADARANRRDAFYVRPAGGVDICNVPVPVRRAQ